LQRDEQAVARGEGVQRQNSQRRRSINEDYVKAL
jgi:hypothetical protein